MARLKHNKDLDKILEDLGDPLAETERGERQKQKAEENAAAAELQRKIELEEERRRNAPDKVYEDWGDW